MPYAKQLKTSGRGIPKLATRIRMEKATEVVPVKMQLSLKNAIPEPKSKWIRELIIRELTR